MQCWPLLVSQHVQQIPFPPFENCWLEILRHRTSKLMWTEKTLITKSLLIGENHKNLLSELKTYERQGWTKHVFLTRNHFLTKKNYVFFYGFYCLIFSFYWFKCEFNSFRYSTLNGIDYSDLKSMNKYVKTVKSLVFNKHRNYITTVKQTNWNILV